MARGGFTLIELLVVTAIVALLAGLLLPSLKGARMAARITKAHAELRSVTIALEVYGDYNAGQLPPTRFSCSTRTAYELPIELGQQRYLPLKTALREQATVDVVGLRDVFDPADTYKYRAPGPAVINESTYLPDAASLWVPDGFPDVAGSEGAYHFDRKTSPVRYAVWSVGPNPQSPKFRQQPGRGPIPSRFWCRGSSDSGYITQYQAATGLMYRSP